MGFFFICIYIFSIIKDSDSVETNLTSGIFKRLDVCSLSDDIERCSYVQYPILLMNAACDKKDISLLQKRNLNLLGFLTQK